MAKRHRVETNAYAQHQKNVKRGFTFEKEGSDLKNRKNKDNKISKLKRQK
jgi:hypothetical protein